MKLACAALGLLFVSIFTFFSVNDFDRDTNNIPLFEKSIRYKKTFKMEKNQLREAFKILNRRPLKTPGTGHCGFIALAGSLACMVDQKQPSDKFWQNMQSIKVMRRVIRNFMIYDERSIAVSNQQTLKEIETLGNPKLKSIVSGGHYINDNYVAGFSLMIDEPIYVIKRVDGSLQLMKFYNNLLFPTVIPLTEKKLLKNEIKNNPLAIILLFLEPNHYEMMDFIKKPLETSNQKKYQGKKQKLQKIFQFLKHYNIKEDKLPNLKIK